MVEILKKVLKFIWAFLTVPYHETEYFQREMNRLKIANKETR